MFIQTRGPPAACLLNDYVLNNCLKDWGPLELGGQGPGPQWSRCWSATDYCHNYAETVRMIMTIVGFSLHQVCDGNSRKVYNTCHTQTLQKINMSLFRKLPDAIKSTQKTQLASTNSEWSRCWSATDYCHNYAETVRMIMTIVGFSLHQVCDGNSRKVYNTCHTQTLQKINMSLFRKLPDAIKSTQKTQLASTNSDCGSFSSLYISCQTRYGDIDNFVSHVKQFNPVGSVNRRVNADWDYVRSTSLHGFRSARNQ